MRKIKNKSHVSGVIKIGNVDISGVFVCLSLNFVSSNFILLNLFLRHFLPNL